MTNKTKLQQSYEDQRQSQIAVRAAFLAQFIRSWDILKLNDLDGTFPEWSSTVVAQISSFRTASSNLAVKGYLESRLLAAPKALEVPVPDLPAINWQPYDTTALISLKITGPQEIKTQIAKGAKPEAARDRALVTSAGSASRQVLTGDRVTTLTAVQADSEAAGWARIGDGDPCAFCALLISRGPAYKTEGSAGFRAHDHCACVPVAVFSKSAAWPGNARAIRAFYDEHTSEFSGQERRKAFRRAWESRPAPAEEQVA